MLNFQAQEEKSFYKIYELNGAINKLYQDASDQFKQQQVQFQLQVEDLKNTIARVSITIFKTRCRRIYYFNFKTTKIYEEASQHFQNQNMIFQCQTDELKETITKVCVPFEVFSTLIESNLFS